MRLSSILSLVSLASTAFGAALTKVNSFGTNPTNAEMYIYVPDKLAAKPPVLVAIHYCTGTASGYFSGTQFRTLADQYGFIVIYPDAPDSGGCWDVHTTQTLTHNAGGDSQGIVSMVKYTLSTYPSADASRVFAVGTSSGAMMINVLAGAYPDIFAGVAGFAGVPYSCFAGSTLWNSACANGQVSKTGAVWGDAVRSGYPGYTGARPKVQLWHGTADTTLNYNNFNEEVKQWTNVLGVSETPSATTSNSPLSGWTRRQYGANMQAISAQGVSHSIPEQANDVISFFGLNQVTSSPTTTTAVTTVPTTTTTAPATTTTAPSGGTAVKWGQCGGSGWTGPTACESGSTCVKVNDWYSQCQ